MKTSIRITALIAVAISFAMFGAGRLFGQAEPTGQETSQELYISDPYEGIQQNEFKFDGTSKPPNQRRHVDLYTILTYNYALQDKPNHPGYLFKFTDEQYEKLFAMMMADQEWYLKIREPVLETCRELARQGHSDDEAFAPLGVLVDQAFEVDAERAKDIAAMLNDEQLELTRQAAMDKAIMLFGGPHRLLKRVQEIYGLQPLTYNSKEEKRVRERIAEHRRKIRELNAELFEDLIDMMPPEHRQALMDTANITYLKKGDEPEGNGASVPKKTAPRRGSSLAARSTFDDDAGVVIGWGNVEPKSESDSNRVKETKKHEEE